jgi:tRNA threonylcarbamoyladenosine biosynthesis protein TsaB
VEEILERENNMKKVVLVIDTSQAKETKVSLQIEEKKFEKKQVHESRRDQDVLQLIDAILQEHSLTVRDLTSLEVITGPGSFTGLRVGVSVANALSYSLNIPVNGKVFSKDNSLVEPEY